MAPTPRAQQETEQRLQAAQCEIRTHRVLHRQVRTVPRESDKCGRLLDKLRAHVNETLTHRASSPAASNLLCVILWGGRDPSSMQHPPNLALRVDAKAKDARGLFMPGADELLTTGSRL